MSNQNARKRKSIALEEDPTTPTESPVKKMRITTTQKQALIDNLQLESKSLRPDRESRSLQFCSN